MQLRRAARRLALLAGWGFATVATPAAADVVDAEIWAGGRTISGDTSSSKFNEYRDLEPGAFGGANFLVEDPNGVTFLWGDFDNVGYDNQSYSLEAGQWGRLRLFGEYSELPHIFSNDARTLYSYEGSSRLLFPDALQGAIQAAPTSAAKSDLLRTNLGNVPGVSDDYQLRTIVGGLIFDPREDLELETAYRQLERSGRRPFGMGFGNPGGNFADFAVPIDEHTNEVTADARYGTGPWNLQVGYLGSFFSNDLNQVTVDNPLRLTDSDTAGAAQGRISLAPNNSMNNFHATGAYDLPLEFPARVTTTFAYGLRQQDQDFLPHTINSAPLFLAAPGLALPQGSLDGKVQTYLANLLATARPLPELDLRARYRYYDFHNDTPVISFPAHVVNDATLDTEIVRNVPNSYKRQQASFDASYRFTREVTLRGGPFWDQWSRSQDREVSRLNEYGGKVALDLKPASWALVRADYLFGLRHGTQYHPFNHLAASLDPNQVDEEEAEFASVGQLAQLRKFDEANRTRNEVKLLTQLILREDLDVSFSGGWALFDYPDSAFGLTKSQNWNVGTEFGYQPVEWASLSVWYTFEDMRLDQESRWRPVGGTPPAVVDSSENNWSSESTDLVHTLGANLDFVLIPDKLDLSFRYTFEQGTGETHSNSAAGCVPAPPATACLPPPGTAADGGNAPNYPDIDDRLQIFATTLSYHFTEHFTLEGFYAFEKLALKDFRVDGLNPFMPFSNVNGSGGVSPSLDVFLGDQVGGYDAHIFGLTASYKF